MALFRFGRPVSIRWNGLLIEGVAGTVFEVPDEYRDELEAAMRVEPTFEWINSDEGATIRARLDALEAGGGGGGASLSNDLPLALGTAAAGTGTEASRDDHVHPTTGLSLVGHTHDTAGYTTIIKQYVKNDTTAKLKGEAVYISSADGTNPIVSYADADTEATSSKTLGLLEQNLSANQHGWVITEGVLTNIDTSAATAGQAVWLSGTAGGRVYGSPPAEPAHSVYLGVVTKANVSTGEIFVKVQNGYELDELHNVSAGSPSNGDIIQYNSSSQMWEKESLSTAGIAATGHIHAGTYDPAGTAASAISTHEAAADPHPTYLTSAEGNAAYATTGHTHTGPYTPTAHASTHNAGGSDALSIDAVAGTGSLRTLGTTATSAAAGNHLHTGVYDPAGTAASAVSTHEADTTSVHGIADTSALLTTSTSFANISTPAGSATTITSTTAGSPTDITGLTYTFTPTYNEDVFVQQNLVVTQSASPASAVNIIGKILVNGTAATPFSYTGLTASHGSPNGWTQGMSHTFVATSGVSYTVKCAAYKSSANGTYSASNGSTMSVIRVRA